MASASAISLSKVEPLTGSNYYIWEMKISAILRSRRLFRPVIEGNEPEETDIETRAAWENANDEAFGIIIVTLSAEQAGLFIGESNAKRVWEELKRIHAGNVEDRRIDTALELKNIQMGGNESVDCYINRARNIATRCAALGQVIPQRELVYHVVRGLHYKYEIIASVLRPQRSATLEETQQTLREEEIRLNSKDRLHNFTKQEKAFKAKDIKFGRKKGENSDKNCFVCGKRGHLAKDCWHRQNQNGSQKNNTGFKNPRGQRELQFKEKGGGLRREYAQVANKYHTEHALSTHSEEWIDIKIKNPQVEIWTLDSGCTTHMSPNKKWMTGVKPIEREINLAENGRSIPAEAMGNIKLTTLNKEGENINICVTNVLYVPDLRTNLLSVRSLVKNGNNVIFKEEGAEIYNRQGELIAQATEKNRMFIVETFLRTEENIPGNCMTAVSPRNRNEDGITPQNDLHNSDMKLWHRRLGHINEDYLTMMKQKEMVRGLGFKNQKLSLCEPCILGKLVQTPFKGNEDEITKKPLELIHMDLCGPMPKESLGGAKYIFVLVDSFSRRIFVAFLKTKEEAFENFLGFKSRFENELGSKIKRVRSDNGKEFINKRFEVFFQKEGIQHQRTVPYSPQSNGVAERANRTLLDKARTMLIDSDLPIEFWAEAMSTATYLQNRTPTKNGGTQTPIEKWGGIIPSVSHVRVFGSMAYYFIPKVKRNKFEPKARKGIFIGYSQTRKAYRIYDYEENEVHEVRTVKFEENKRGSELLRNKEIGKNQFDEFKYNDEEPEFQIEDAIIPQGEVTIQQTQNDKDGQEETQENQQNEEIPIRRHGRRPGETNEILKVRHQLELLEREEKLRTEGVRRSSRLRNTQQATISIDKEKYVPNSYKEAITCSQSENWKEAMEDEIHSLKSHKVWTLVNRSPDMKIMKNKWVFTIKENPDNSINRRKARLVVVGSGQRAGIDYEESFAPVMRMESLRTLIAIAANQRLKLRQYDVKTAYLHGELRERLFMKQPEGFENVDHPTKVCELQKGLYGLPQSGRCWNIKLNEVLAKEGFIQLESDPCVHKIIYEDETLFIGIYVDDILVAGKNDHTIDLVMNKLKEHFVLTSDKNTISFLGIEVTETKEGFELSQKGYVSKIIEKFALTECKPVKTPGDTNQDLDQYEESLTADQTKFQEMIGSLMYLSVGTRPDITYQISRLSQYTKDPRQIHMVALKRIYRYLQGSKDYKLVYRREEGVIQANTDASWCSTKDSKSFTGYTIKLGTSLVNWKCSKQHLVALSTCEAELMAICEGVRDLKWISSFIQELGMEKCVTIPLMLRSDSKSAIDWIKNGTHHPRTKHINRKFFFIRDEVKKGNICIEHVNSEEMEADALTKNLTKEKLETCARSWGLQITCEKPFLASKRGIVKSP